jgi:predicted lipase
MNKPESLLCALIAQATYTNRCQSDDFYITAKFENKGTDTQGFFGVAFENTFVVAFRGSEETGTADWITDLKFLQTPFPYIKRNRKIKVHLGFNQAYQSVRDTVIRIVQESAHERVICTGHSLGGGLAKLCALDIAYNVPGKTVYVYTYGAPKVGNAEFAKASNKKVPNTFRFVNGSDIVPTIPLGDYAHVGQLCRIGRLVQEEGEESSWSWNDLLGRVVDRLDDHFPYKYIEQLQLWLKS